MTVNNINGNVIVKLLISIISVSVISTILMNTHQDSDHQIGYRDISSMMSMQAKNAFDKIGYHFKLAGYANSNNQKPICIKHGEATDTLIIWHNDVEIIYHIDFDKGYGILCESIDGTNSEIIEGVESLRFIKSTPDLATIEITLIQGKDRLSSRIISKSYSTTVRLKNYL